jgi:hypothetical protein
MARVSLGCLVGENFWVIRLDKGERLIILFLIFQAPMQQPFKQQLK